MITVLVKNPRFGCAEVREQFLELIARTIDGKAEAVYHQCNEHDDTYYSVGHGNDWRVKFNETSFSLTYRYQSNLVKAEEALAQWLSHRLNAELYKNA